MNLSSDLHSLNGQSEPNWRDDANGRSIQADIGVMAVIVRNQARSGGRRSVEFENSMARLQGVFNRTDPFDCRLMGGIKVMTGQWARFLNEGQKQERIVRKDDYCYPEPKYSSLDTSHVPVVFSFLKSMLGI